MDDKVLNSDNGIIALALHTYILFASEEGADQQLIDRASELEVIFKNKSTKERYEF